MHLCVLQHIQSFVVCADAVDGHSTGTGIVEPYRLKDLDAVGEDDDALAASSDGGGAALVDGDVMVLTEDASCCQSGQAGAYYNDLEFVVVAHLEKSEKGERE